MIREDYILRLIKQVADVLARIAGKRSRGEYAAAVDEAVRAWDGALGVPRELVDVMDTPALAQLLREPDKMRLGAQLLVEEALALAGKGDPLAAAVAKRRALELYLEARAIDPRGEDDAAILELSRSVPASQLDDRYRAE